jgi:enoyl-CoA hydratase/carnithine racemase
VGSEFVQAREFDAHNAERYGWINRDIPDAELDEFVERFAKRVGHLWQIRKAKKGEKT